MVHLKEFADYLTSLETKINPRNVHVTPSQPNEQQQSVQPPPVNLAVQRIVPNPLFSNPPYRQPSEQQQQPPHHHKSVSRDHRLPQVNFAEPPTAQNSAVSDPDPVIPYPPMARNFAVENPYSLEGQNVTPAHRQPSEQEQQPLYPPVVPSGPVTDATNYQPSEQQQQPHQANFSDPTFRDMMDMIDRID